MVFGLAGNGGGGEDAFGIEKIRKLPTFPEVCTERRVPRKQTSGKRHVGTRGPWEEEHESSNHEAIDSNTMRHN